MSDRNRELSDQQTLAEPVAPKANDDLTIAEHLRLWLRSNSRDGLLVFDDGEGSSLSLAKESVDAFTEDYGALHPGDYQAKFDRDWRDDFAALGGQA
ncbi:hypothetical protein OJ996_19940 [Luteolibacter sp. GHJ8]|uniref:Uncharacterized protein n=1 Tax=Luteolibacter rhizosphaerae TaxID=2989719 RepID=A0ABT3G8S4_9BACT|nr:hypothetical protein [Luteolibacter rhizosphaerae]MCW1915869.1 hypothetical protein [Luteolibacter rhizosphaerae]